MSEEEAFSKLLHSHFAPFASLSAAQTSRLYRHYQLLAHWNRVLNLTAIHRLEEVVVRHYCESLFAGIHLPSQPVSVLDVGSGAGFPGIPMAVLRPDCRFTLAESHQRKAVFLREATRDYTNVRIAACRADQIREAFQWTVSRAVRWEDVVRVASAEIALLIGQEDAEALTARPGFTWAEPIPVPWGKRRVLALGRRST